MSTSQIKSHTTRRLKFQLVFTVVLVAATLFITWLILADSSPLHDYFIWHTTLPNLWAMTIFIPYVLAALLSGTLHSPNELVAILFAIIQWFIVGWLISMPVSKLWVRLRK
jgi:hypothetical protein